MSKFERYHPDGDKPHPASGWIWVFGSNLAGRHGAGAALVARELFGAELGQGLGPTGRAYAIPTKDARLNVIPLAQIRAHIADFLAYARERPDQLFFVTRIGCGLAGYKDREIAPLFREPPSNLSLPLNWKPYLEATTPRSYRAG